MIDVAGRNLHARSYRLNRAPLKLMFLCSRRAGLSHMIKNVRHPDRSRAQRLP
jgi:hypothetical protein